MSNVQTMKEEQNYLTILKAIISLNRNDKSIITEVCEILRSNQILTESQIFFEKDFYETQQSKFLLYYEQMWQTTLNHT
jgi:hypothetical protein